ncbi:GTA-gp10 family protein [Aquibium sp. LZ166]|uniref:GTA-gp10 family protein n=1 Tax=Aquibium pacificus TaxID=3153579 RepID=A0ABV3SJF3_9HYPH
MLIDHVKARFGGKDVTFKIPRADLEAFESYTGQNSFALFTSLAGKTWGLGDVSRVLKFAMANASERRLYRTLALTGAPAARLDGIKNNLVDKTLAANAPGDYVPLCVSIIGASLFGLDPEEASFSDGS